MSDLPDAPGTDDANEIAEEKELVESIARALVDKPDEVEVTVIEGEQSTILELRVAQEDIGKVVGKQGRIVKAMRILLRANSRKNSKRTVLEILG